MTQLLNAFLPTPHHPEITWDDYLASGIKGLIEGERGAENYARRAAIDYVAFLQIVGRAPAISTPFVSFSNAGLHDRMRELVDDQHDEAFDRAVTGINDVFQDEVFRLMCQVIPAFHALEGQDFNTLSNVYVEAARRLPTGAGVFYGLEWTGHLDHFPTVKRPSILNRLNLGFSLKDYPSEKDLVLSAARHASTINALIEDGRIELADDDMPIYHSEEAKRRMVA